MVDIDNEGTDKQDSSTNCTPPAIEEFPRPIIPQYVRAKGGLLIHFLISAYMFLGLSIVCDDYFVPALERMVECEKKIFKRFPALKKNDIHVLHVLSFILSSFTYVARCSGCDFHGSRIFGPRTCYCCYWSFHS